MKIDLKGKVVLLTGASRGIGLAIARQLIEAKASVALHYNQNKQDLIPLIGENKSSCFKADLNKKDQVVQLFNDVCKTYKKVDILINNAGIAISSPFDKNPIDWILDWEKTMTVNLNSSALLCKLAIPHFIDNSVKGKIINIASRAAFRGDTQDYLAYAASKGGMVALTRSIARAFGKQNITAFTIAPGFVKTEMSQDFFDKYGEEACLKDLALTSIPEPEDVSPSVVFLCSDYCTHASGCTIDINSASYVH